MGYTPDILRCKNRAGEGNSTACGLRSAPTDCGGTRRLYLTAQERPAPESILYLRVADIRSACEELRSRGVQFSQAPHMIHRHPDGTEEWLAHFNDPEGRPLAIMSAVKP